MSKPGWICRDLLELSVYDVHLGDLLMLFSCVPLVGAVPIDPQIPQSELFCGRDRVFHCLGPRCRRHCFSGWAPNITESGKVRCNRRFYHLLSLTINQSEPRNLGTSLLSRLWTAVSMVLCAESHPFLDTLQVSRGSNNSCRHMAGDRARGPEDGRFVELSSHNRGLVGQRRRDNDENAGLAPPVSRGKDLGAELDEG